MVRDADDELPRRTTAVLRAPRDLGPLSLDELNTYISELEAEISRVRHEIATKQAHRSGVENLFRR